MNNFNAVVNKILLKHFLFEQRLHLKLTDLQDKIEGGAAPMPLMTCVNVKSDRSARSFHGMFLKKVAHFLAYLYVCLLD